MSGSSDIVTWGAVSDVGRVRSINQDSIHVDPTLFVVADGMGGHQGGEVASAVAIETMRQPEDGEPPRSVDALVDRVRVANVAIIDRANDDEALAGMGTTLCALAILEPDWKGGVRIGLVNVGDSRIYRFADGKLEQISRDHSLVADLVRQGHLTAAEAEEHPQRNIVTRALGIVHDVDVDSWELVARRGECYVLCSDGLVNEVADSQIAATMRRLDDPTAVVDDLVRQANENGARDNVSVVVVRVDHGPEGQPDALPMTPRSIQSVDSEGPTDSHDAASVYDGPPVGAVDGQPRVGRQGSTTSPRPGRGRVGRARAVVSTAVIVVIVGAGLLLIGLYARNNYYVSFDGEQVVIYQGRPGGVLWFDPTIEQPTALLRSDLTEALALELDADPEFGTFAEAEDYVADLTERLADVPSSGSG